MTNMDKSNQNINDSIKYRHEEQPPAAESEENLEKETWVQIVFIFFLYPFHQ